MKKVLIIIALLSSLLSEGQLRFPNLSLQHTTVTPPAPLSGRVAYLLGIGGQSNASEQASPYEYWSPFRPQDIISTKEFMWTGSAFAPLTVPSYPFTGSANNSGNGLIADASFKLAGVELPLSRLLADGLNDSIFVVKHAIGGTHLFQNSEFDWNAASSGEYLDQWIAKMQAAITNLRTTYDTVVVLLYWGQGEADAWVGQSTAQYLSNENALYAKICTQLGRTNIPIAVMQISSTNSGATFPQNSAIQTAQASFVSAAPTTRKIINIDPFVKRDDYHFFADAYIYMAEEADKLYLDTTFANSTKPSDPAGYIVFKTPYPWYLNGVNNYYGQGSQSRDAIFPAGTGGLVSLKYNGTNATYFSLNSAVAGGSNVYNIIFSSGTLAVQYNTTDVFSTSLTVNNRYGFKMLPDGTISVVASTDGITFTTLFTFSQNGNADWWLKMSMPFNVQWDEVRTH